MTLLRDLFRFFQPWVYWAAGGLLLAAMLGPLAVRQWREVQRVEAATRAGLGPPPNAIVVGGPPRPVPARARKGASWKRQ